MARRPHIMEHRPRPVSPAAAVVSRARPRINSDRRRWQGGRHVAHGDRSWSLQSAHPSSRFLDVMGTDFDSVLDILHSCRYDRVQSQPLRSVITSPPVKLQSIVIDVFVCLSVCSHISKTKFSVHVTCGRYSVLL